MPGLRFPQLKLRIGCEIVVDFVGVNHVDLDWKLPERNAVDIFLEVQLVVDQDLRDLEQSNALLVFGYTGQPKKRERGE